MLYDYIYDMKTYSPFLNFLYRSMLMVEGISGRHIEGAQMIILKNKHILLIKPTYRPHWELPGGKVEKGEAPETAAVRETKEEARIFVKKIARKLGMYSDHYLNRSVLIHVYIAEIWEELDLWKPGLEIAQRGFFPLHDLPEDISQATLLRIKELSLGNDKEFSGEWQQ